MRFSSIRLLVFVLVMLSEVSVDAESSRIALVIGNAEYSQSAFPTLSNPVNDAQDVAAALQDLCFEVMLKANANRETMLAAIEEFGQRLAASGGIGIFYYSGHGLQYNQKNYLIPLNTAIHKDTDIEAEAVDANLILSQMETARNDTNILIFDTCREAFASKTFQDAEKGFVAMKGPKGSAIVFSTALGQTSFGDADTRNSLYTGHFVQALREKSREDLLKMLREINRSVAEETTFYQVTPAAWRVLHKKGLPEEILLKLQHPQLYQKDFPEEQFIQILTNHVLDSSQQDRYTTLILDQTRQVQEPWLYTNITEEVILADSCLSAPLLSTSGSWKLLAGVGIGGGAIAAAVVFTSSDSNGSESGNENGNGNGVISLSGTFKRFYEFQMPGPEIDIQHEETLTLVEQGNRITGTLFHRSIVSDNCCSAESEVPVQGERLDDTSARLEWGDISQTCVCNNLPIQIVVYGGTSRYTLLNSGNTLQSEERSFERVD